MDCSPSPTSLLMEHKSLRIFSACIRSTQVASNSAFHYYFNLLAAYSSTYHP